MIIVSEGQIISGAISSLIVITWLQVAVFPQRSAIKYTLVTISGQFAPSEDWE